MRSSFNNNNNINIMCHGNTCTAIRNDNQHYNNSSSTDNIVPRKGAAGA